MKLRDRFVYGLTIEQIQKRLLSEDNLTYDKAVKIALAMESAIKDSGELQLHSKPLAPVNKVYKASWKEKVMGQQIHPSVVDVDIVAIHLIDVNLKILPADNVEIKDICSQCVN